MRTKPKLLLHDCCAPCGGFLSKQLEKDFDLTVYYDNPNIYPQAEFIKRAEEARKFFVSGGIGFVLVDWDHGVWQKLVEGLEAEPEQGKRCKLCYYYRLKNTAEFAKQNGFDFFATTLTISPHKDSRTLNNLGQALAKRHNIEFLAQDWKKHDGFRKAMDFAKQEGFYRQNYCGCEFSSIAGKG